MYWECPTCGCLGIAPDLTECPQCFTPRPADAPVSPPENSVSEPAEDSGSGAKKAAPAKAKAKGDDSGAKDN